MQYYNTINNNKYQTFLYNKKIFKTCLSRLSFNDNGKNMAVSVPMITAKTWLSRMH